MRMWTLEVGGQKYEFNQFEKTEEVFAHQQHLYGRVKAVDTINTLLKRTERGELGCEDLADRLFRLNKELVKASTSLMNDLADLLVSRSTNGLTREQVYALFPPDAEEKAKEFIGLVFAFLQNSFPGEELLKNLPLGLRSTQPHRA